MYAPVGRHKELLPYLVRRLLENGTNRSFVRALNNKEQSLDALIEEPAVLAMEGSSGKEAVIPAHRHLSAKAIEFQWLEFEQCEYDCRTV